MDHTHSVHEVQGQHELPSHAGQAGLSKALATQIASVAILENQSPKLFTLIMPVELHDVLMSSKCQLALCLKASYEGDFDGNSAAIQQLTSVYFAKVPLTKECRH